MTMFSGMTTVASAQKDSSVGGSSASVEAAAVYIFISQRIHTFPIGFIGEGVELRTGVFDIVIQSNLFVHTHLSAPVLKHPIFPSYQDLTNLSHTERQNGYIASGIFGLFRAIPVGPSSVNDNTMFREIASLSATTHGSAS